MVESGDRPSAEEREARRALLVDALRALPGAGDRDAAAATVMRNLDAYIESAPSQDSGAAQLARTRLRAAIRDLLASEGDAPERIVEELDEYLAVVRGGPRETPVVDFDRLPGREIPWVRYILITLAAVTLTAAAAFSTGGLILGGLVVLIWLVAIVAITSS